jgi:hypothetical protein
VAAILPVTQRPPVAYLGNLAAPAEIWSTTKEIEGTPYPCCRVQRSDNGAQYDIPWVGKDADAATFAQVTSGTTGLLRQVYGQAAGKHAIQTNTSRMQTAIVDVDGKLSFVGGAGKQLVVADDPVIKPAKVHWFVLMRPGYVTGAGGNQGCVLCYAGTGAYWQVARYGFGLDFGNAIQAPRNGQTSGFESVIEDVHGQGHVGDFHVWDWANNTLDLRHDAVPLTSPVASADVTYPVATQLQFGADFDLNDGFALTWRMKALYDSVRSDRDQISGFIMNYGAAPVVKLPSSFATPDGFQWLPRYVPTFVRDPVDANDIRWWYEEGGYKWPSFMKAANVANGVQTVQYILKPGDTDVIVTGAERAERGGYLGVGEAKITKGSTWETFVQFRIFPGVVQTGSWCLGNQHHYDVGASPDLVYTSYKNDQIQVVTQRNGADTNRGSPVAYARGTVYALRIKGFWSVSGNSDTLEVWFGPNGTTLTKIVDVAAGQIFSTDATLAYWKDGVYAGGLSGVFILETFNYMASLTADAFAAFVTNQPALAIPTP